MMRAISAVFSRSHRTTAAVLVVAGGVAACLLVVTSVWADPAGAKKPTDLAAAQDNPLRYETQNYSPSPDRSAVVKVVAKCQEGYSVIGGGFDQHIDTNRDPWELIASRPAMAVEDGAEMQGAGWVVEMGSNPWLNPGVGPFAVYAVCAPNSREAPSVRGVSYRRATTLISGRANTADVTPSCQRGGDQQAIGGGFSFREGLGTLIRSQPNFGDWPNSWLVTGYKQTDAVRVDGYVVCASEPYGVSELNRQEAAKTQFRNPINASSARCPDGTYLLGGGAGVPNNSDGKVDWSHIRPDTGNQSWGVGAYNRQLVSQLTVWTYAMCGKLGGPKAGGGQDKLSGKNPGWGDGEGGGRSKEKGSANSAEKGAPTTTNSDEPFGQDAGGGTTSQF